MAWALATHRPERPSTGTDVPAATTSGQSRLRRWLGCRGMEGYQALVLVSFGAPERRQDVMPFLERVTAGRGIPRAASRQWPSTTTPPVAPAL